MRFLVRFLAAALAVAGFSSPATAQTVGMSTDVGNVPVAGSSSYAQSGSVYQLSGTGSGLGGSADAFHFAYYQSVLGDGQIVVRLASADVSSQAALVLRESLDAGAADAAVVVQNGNAQFVRRTATGNNAVADGTTSATVPCWLKLVRSGTTVSVFLSPDGLNWTSLGTDTVTTAGTSLYVGLAVSNGMAGATNTVNASFDNVASTFLPNEGLLLWLRADMGVTQDANGDVSTWADQSGNGNDATQASSSNQPLAVAAAIGTQPVIRFDGSSSFLQLPSGFNDFTQGITALVVAQPTSTASGARFFDLGNGANEQNIVFARYGTGNGMQFYSADTQFNLLTPDMLVLNQVQLVECKQDPGAQQATVYKNGNLVLTQGAGPIVNVTRTSNLIAECNWGGPLYQGDIAEVVLFKRPLTDAERQTWEAYLNAKYQFNPPPAAPTALTVTSLSSTQAALSWSESSQNVTGYTVERQNADGTWSVVASLPGGATQFIDSGLNAGQQYNYQLVATNLGGNSPAAMAGGATAASSPGVFPTSGVQLWFRADAGVTTDANGLVSAWADESGNGNNLSQGSAGNRPALLPNVYNGEPALHFDGSSTSLASNAAFDLLAGSNDVSVIVVTKPGASQPTYADMFDYDHTSIGFVYEQNGNQLNDFSPGFAPVQLQAGQLCVSSLVKGGTACQVYYNGEIVSNGSAPATLNPAPPRSFLIGNWYQGGRNYNGDIAELMIFNRALTDIERQTVETYVNAKYAITGTPAAPSNLAATAISTNQVNLFWTASSTASGYSLERKDAAASDSAYVEVAAIAGGEVQAYIDGGLTTRASYSYRLRAYNLAGYSGYLTPTTVNLPTSGTTSLPTDNLLLWLKPDAGVTAASSGLVSTWTDASGNGNDATASAGSQPQLVTGVLNGHPVVRFDGASSYLQLPSGFSDFTQGITALVVAMPASNASYSRFFDLGNGAGQQNIVFNRYSTGNGLEFYCQNTTFELDTLGGLTLNQYELLEANQDPVAQQATAYRNGVVLGSTSAGPILNTTRTSNFIGRSNWGDPLFQGDIVEVLLFNHALSDTDRQAWENYLNTKYNYDPVPTAPTQLVATALSSSQAALNWIDSFGNINDFLVEQQNADGTWSVIATLPAGTTNYTVTGLSPGAAYNFQVLAANRTGNSVAATASLSIPASVEALPASDIRLWLRADSGTITDSNGLLSQWMDTSGNGLSATQGSGNQPTLVSDTINGQPVVHFDGSSSFLYLPGGVTSGLTGAEVFVVLRVTDPITNVQHGFWRFDDGSIAEYPWSDGNVYDTFGTNGQYGFSPGVAPLDQFNLYNVSAAAAGTWTARMNGEVLRSSLNNTVRFSAGAYTLGRDRDGHLFAGDIAEVLIFDRALTDSERQGVEQYLAGKYALASAPAAPANLGARVLSPTQVSLTWQYPAGISAVRFGIQRRSASSGGYQTIATVENATSFLDNTAVAGTAYSYQIVATDLAGNVSAASSSSSVNTPTTGPALPTNGMRLWLQADAGTTGALNEWVDQSGNGNDAQQGTAGQQPTVVANALNGQPVVHFDGNNDFLYLPGSVTSGLTGAEVFVVLRATDPITNVQHGFWRFDDGSIAGYPWSDGNVYDTFGTNGQYGFSAGVAPLDQFNLYNVSAAATGLWTARMNGEVLSSNPNNTVRFSAGAYTLGRDRDGHLFAGDIAEMIIFDHALAESDRIVVEQYLAGKYALTTAPVAPTGLSVRPLSPTQVSLTWAYPAAGTSSQFTIERAAAGTNNYQAIGTVDNATSFIDNTAVAGTAYSYEVVATDLAGNVSASSAAAQATTAVSGSTLPTDGLRLWLMADAGTTGGVDDWVDQSGNGNDAQQGTAGQQPTVVANALNGQPVVHFDGNNDFLYLPSSVVNGLSESEMFVVLRAADPVTNVQRGLWRFDDGSIAEYPWSDGNVYDTFGTNGQYGFSPGSVPLDQFNLYNVSAATTGAWTARLNGETVRSSTNNTVRFSAGEYTLGRDRNGRLFAGDIAEVLIFDHALDEDDRIAIQQYLASKYNLASAPTAPTGLSARALSPTQVSLTWAYPVTATASQFTVQRAAAGTNSYEAITTVGNATSFIDSTAVAGTAYSYEVVATDFAGNVSAASNQTQATTPASGPVLPTTGLRVWLEADSGAAVTLNDWVDQSGNGNDAQQGSPGGQPTLVANTLNGQPVVRFGGGQYLQFPGNVFDNLGEVEAFVVLRAVDPLTNNCGLWRFSDSQNAFYPLGNGAIYETLGTNNQYGPIASSAPLDQFNLYNVSAAANGEYTMRMNEQVLFNTANNPLRFSAGAYLLGQTRDGYMYQGDIAEVLIFDHALGDSDRLAVEQYLAGKYALVSAPATPTAVNARALSPTQVSLTWQYPQANSATQFTIERAITGTDNYQVVAVVNNSTSFLDNTAVAGTAYSYEVVAGDLAGDVSAASGAVAVTTPASGSALPTADLRVWLEADAGTTGGTLASWVDQSGNGNNAQQGNPGNQPTVVASMLNGQPVIHFDGSDSLQLLDNPFAGASAGEVLVVLRATDPLTNNCGLWRMSDSNNAFYPLANGAIYETFGSNTQYGPITSSAPLDQFNLYNVSAAANGTWTIRMDEQVLFSTATNTPDFSAGAYLLGQTRDGYPFQGDIAEMLIFDNALSDTDRLAWETYLNAKYNYEPVPTAPTQLIATALSSAQVALSWVDNFYSVSGFRIESQNLDGTWSVVATLAANTTSYIITGLNPGTAYTFRVIATDLAGDSLATTASLSTFASGDGLPLDGLQLWLRADAGTVADANALVSQWLDRSGNGSTATQTNPSAQPQVITNALNSKPALHFNGSDQLQLPSSLGAADNFTIYTVVRPTATEPIDGETTSGVTGVYSHPSFLFAGYTNVQGASAEVSVGTNGASVYEYADSYLPALAVGATDLSGGFSVVGMEYQNQQPSIYRNGFAVSTGLTSTQSQVNGPTAIGLGDYGGFQGDVAEVLIYNRALTEAERRGVEAYLLQKYQLASVPATPTTLQAIQLSSTENLVTWNPQLGNVQTSFVVQSATSANGPFTTIGTVDSAGTYLDNTAVAGQTYYYRVYAQNGAGQSAPTAAVATINPEYNQIPVPTNGLQLWLMSDSVWQSSVGFWHDYSGNGNDAQQTNPSAQPQILAAAVNGKPALHFNGSDQLQLPSSLGAADNFTIYTVVRPTATEPIDGETTSGVTGVYSHPSFLFAGYTNVQGASAEVSVGTNGASVYEYADSYLPALAVSPADLSNGFNVVGVEYQNQQPSIYANGLVSLLGLTSTQSQVNGPTAIGLGDYGGFQGDVAEVLIYNRALTEAERQSVEQYLDKKYLPPQMDADDDGLTNGQEAALGTNPLNPDTNGDGLRDGVSVALGINPLATGGPNYNTPPNPNGSGGGTTPPANPGNNTPLVITLITPANAVLLP